MACCPGGHSAEAIEAQAGFVWSPPVSAEATPTPSWKASFNELTIQKDLDDGYWIEAFPYRTQPLKSEGPVGPEIIAYGLGVKGKTSEIRMYRNPFNTMKNQLKPETWSHTVIKSFNFPVAVTYGELRKGSNLNDVIICHDYGPSMDDLNKDGGIVSWLRNPGNKQKGDWEIKKIGKFIAMHRLKTGYFTQKQHLEIMALPIMTASRDRETPAPVIIYKPTSWENDGTPTAWETIRPLDNTFRLIHDVQVIHSTTGGLDKAIVAGREGISLMWADEKSGRWTHANVGTGIPQSRKPFKNPYWGSGSVATARVGSDSVGYIATCEAFHGNLVSVYVKPPGARPDKIVTSENWRRFVIDDFGPLKDKDFTGTIHYVQCADLDGSGVDSIIVACMGWPKGTAENCGTYVYKPVDLARGLFTRFKISDASAGRIAIADYRCSGTLDVATISYSVPNYLETDHPAIRVMLNNTKNTRHSIKAQKLGDEVMIRVPRAATAEFVNELPFLDIGGKRLSVVVLPPHKEYLLGESFTYQEQHYDADGVKVVNGSLSWNTPKGNVKRTIAVDRYKAESMIPNSHVVKAGDTGAIFIRLTSSIDTSLPGMRFEEMHDVATINCLPFSAEPEARDMTFPWVPCSERDWGKGKFNWPFFNAVGFHLLYDDDTLTNFCHIQAWTLGHGQTAAFHNHSDKSFCEIHACISNGTHKGGMYWAKEDSEEPGADEYMGEHREEKDPVKLAKYTKKVTVDDMQEHGPLWRFKDELPQLRDNDTVDYPFHAWLAGPKVAGVKEAFDVWLAFEFPSSEFQKDVSKFNGCASCN